MITVAQALRDAATSLQCENPQADAELLLAAALDRPRTWLYAHADEALSAPQAQAFASLTMRRRRGEPVAMILGRQGFWSLALQVSAATLIPRPETELLVELALRLIPAGQVVEVLDLGTGSGAIALALAAERPLARVTALEQEADALAIATANALRLGLERVRMLRGDWFSAIPGLRYEVIVANPPYIADDDPHLEQGDLRFEPRVALASGPDGLDAIRRIVLDAPAHLSPGGTLLLEHGFRQGQQVRSLLQDAGFEAIQTHADLAGLDRVSCGTWG